MLRHKNIASSGALEVVFEHTDEFLPFDVEVVQSGADVAGWKTFVAWAEQGGLFAYYPDNSQTSYTLYNLWDDNWTAAYLAPGFFTFKMLWRAAEV
jgi:hypothetical protein